MSRDGASAQPHRVHAPDDGSYPLEGEPEPPEEEPKPRLRGESGHKRLEDERFEGDARGGWQTTQRQLDEVAWQLEQGHAEPIVYRGDGGAVGLGQGYSNAIKKGSKTRAAERQARYGKGQEVRLFPRDNVAGLLDWYRDELAPIVRETPGSSDDSRARVHAGSRDATFEDEHHGDDESTSDQSVIEAAAFRSGSEASLTRNDPARLLLARETKPTRHQAELRRAWQWIEAEIAAYPWGFARQESAEPARIRDGHEWVYDLPTIEGFIREMAADLPDPWQVVLKLAAGVSENDIAREFGVTRYRIQKLKGEMAFAGWAGGKPEFQPPGT